GGCVGAPRRLARHPPGDQLGDDPVPARGRREGAHGAGGGGGRRGPQEGQVREKGREGREGGDQRAGRGAADQRRAGGGRGGVARPAGAAGALAEEAPAPLLERAPPGRERRGTGRAGGSAGAVLTGGPENPPVLAQRPGGGSRRPVRAGLDPD